MILSASINLFDGEELLDAKLRALRSEIDHISIIYQTRSYAGNPCSPLLLGILDQLVKQGLVDELLEYQFEPDPFANPQIFEADKRTRGLELARKFGATHFITMDADEFILPEAMAYAKQQVIEHDYDATACKLIDYWISPRYQVRGLAEAWGDYLYVPLIYKIRPGIAFTAEKIHEHYFCIADTTRKLPTQNPHRLDDHVIMHHMTTIRAQRGGLISKYKNRSSYIPPALPAEHMGDLLRSWAPNHHWGPVTDEVEDIFAIEESFIRQNLTGRPAGESYVIREWDIDRQSSLRGDCEKSDLIAELEIVTAIFTEFMARLRTDDPEKALQLFDPNYKDLDQVENWIRVYGHLLAIVQGSLNLSMIRQEGGRYTAVAAISWIGEKKGQRAKVRADTSNEKILSESAVAATKEVGGSWNLVGFENLW
jgi:hypothetical protein